MQLGYNCFQSDFIFSAFYQISVEIIFICGLLVLVLIL